MAGLSVEIIKIFFYDWSDAVNITLKKQKQKLAKWHS